MSGWLKFLAQRAEYFVLTGALLVIAALVTWWTIFFRRMLHEHEAVSRGLLTLTLQDEPEKLKLAVDGIALRSDRMVLMIAGESGMFLLALVLCFIVMFVVARRRQEARMRMERMLQFTSHELKTPIAGVRALLQSLSLGSIPADAQARFIQSGIGECDRLEHLAETILAYQRAVVRGAGAQPQPLRGDELVNEVLAHRARTFGTESLDVAPAAPVTIWADRDAFRVVLENLLDNARKYGGGKVEVGTRADGSEWSVTVRDHGQGFDPKLAERLFDPFERREQGAVTHGSGLGLSISRTLARQMGGNLTASSDGNGKGACFSLTLKVAPAGGMAADAK